MSNFLSMLWIDVGCSCERLCSLIIQVGYWIATQIFKVLGLFADLLNIGFYIFSGIDVSDGDAGSRYAIKIASTGEKKNILDYFVMSKTMQQTYLWLALLGLLLIVVFTIYRIIKQDYFEKAGPRSKGPIFRNVAISCISFLLVIPIFWLIIHASSFLALQVMAAMGMDIDVLAGAKIFTLSFSDGGQMFKYVNNAFIKYGGKAVDLDTKFGWMFDLQDHTLFTMYHPSAKAAWDTDIKNVLTILGVQESSLALAKDNNKLQYTAGVSNNVNVYFYWYIFLVGIVVGIKTLYKLLLAMLQRIFMLMGLFLVAPSPISQYVLDDGQKFKSWLQKSIQEGLRLVVAVMSFGIYLIVLNLITDVDFMAAFTNAARASSSTMEDTDSVRPELLVYNGNLVRRSLMLDTAACGSIDPITGVYQPCAETAEGSGALNVLASMANAFMKIFVLVGAGGAVTDLDPILSEYISGAKGSLDAGATGKAADGVAQAGKNAAMAAARFGLKAAGGLAANVVGAVGGATVGGIAGAIKNRGAEDKGAEAGIKEAENPSGGGDGDGGDKSDDTSTTKPNPNGPGDTGTPTEEGKTDGGDTKEPDGTDTDGEGGSKKGDGEGGSKKGVTIDDDAKERAKVRGKKASKLRHRHVRGILRAFGSVGKAGLKSLRDIRRDFKDTLLPALATSALTMAGVDATKAANFVKDAKADMDGFDKSFMHASGLDKAQEKANKWMDEGNAFGENMASADRNAKYNYDAVKATTVTAAWTEQASADAAALNSAIGEEGVAAEALDGAQAEADAAGNVATEANQQVDKKFRGKSTAGTNLVKGRLAENKRKKEDLEKANQGLVNQYGGGTVEGLRAAAAAGDAKARKALQSYESNSRAITGLDTSIKADEKRVSTGERKLKLAQTFSGRGEELASLGITARMSFDDAKRIVDASSNTELQEMFADENAKSIYEDSTVETARISNETAHESTTRLQEAQTNYNAAHTKTEGARKKMQTTQQALTRAAETSKRVNHMKYQAPRSLRRELSTQRGITRYESMDENGVLDEKKYKEAMQKSEQEFIKKHGDELTSRDIDGANSRSRGNIKYRRADGTKAETVYERGVYEDVDGWAEFSTSTAVTRIHEENDAARATFYDAYRDSAGFKRADAENRKLEGRHASLSGATEKPADVSQEDWDRYQANKGILERTEESMSTMTYAEATRLGIGNEHGVYHATLAGNADRAHIIEEGGRAIHSLGTIATSAETRMTNVATKYEGTERDMSVVNKVIAGGGTGLTPAQLKVLQRNGNPTLTATSTPDEVLAAANVARGKITDRQQDLAHQAETIRHDQQQAQADARVIADAITKAIGGKTSTSTKGTTAGDNTTVVNNVTNVNNGTTADGTGTGGLSTPTSSVDAGPSVYEKMQTQGIKVIEQMLRQMKVENNELRNKVENIDKKLDD